MQTAVFVTFITGFEITVTVTGSWVVHPGVVAVTVYVVVVAGVTVIVGVVKPLLHKNEAAGSVLVAVRVVEAPPHKVGAAGLIDNPIVLLTFTFTSSVSTTWFPQEL